MSGVKVIYLCRDIYGDRYIQNYFKFTDNFFPKQLLDMAWWCANSRGGFMKSNMVPWSSVRNQNS